MVTITMVSKALAEHEWRTTMTFLALHPRLLRVLVVIGSIGAVALAAGNGKWG